MSTVFSPGAPLVPSRHSYWRAVAERLIRATGVVERDPGSDALRIRAQIGLRLFDFRFVSCNRRFDTITLAA
jgi:hypothetical protein